MELKNKRAATNSGLENYLMHLLQTRGTPGGNGRVDALHEAAATIKELRRRSSLLAGELEAVHEMLDAMGLPRQYDGEPLDPVSRLRMGREDPFTQLTEMVEPAKTGLLDRTHEEWLVAAQQFGPSITTPEALLLRVRRIRETVERAKATAVRSDHIAIDLMELVGGMVRK